MFAGDDFAAGFAVEADDALGDDVFAGAEAGLAIGADFAAGADAAGDADDAGDEDGEAAGVIPESLAADFLLLLLEAGAEVEVAEPVLFPAAAGAFEVDPDAAGALAVESPLAAADFLLFLLLLDSEPVASAFAGAAALSFAAGALESVAVFLVLLLLVLLLLVADGVAESVAAAD